MSPDENTSIVMRLEVATLYQWSDIQNRCLVILGPKESAFWDDHYDLTLRRSDLVYRAMRKICDVTESHDTSRGCDV